MALLQSAEGGSVSVKKWKKLGEHTESYSDGSMKTFVVFEETSGVMDQNGKIRNPRTRNSSFTKGDSYSEKARAFLDASPQVWFKETTWSSIFWPTPPPSGSNLPRGFEVVQTYPHDNITNARYDVIKPVKAGALRFQLEPQDASIPTVLQAGLYTLEAYIIGGPEEITVEWFEVDANGVAQPTMRFTRIFENHISVVVTEGLYFVEITQGNKTIRSRTAKVGRGLAGHQDQVEPLEPGATILGRVWKDVNQNDIDDGEAEPGYSGLEVTLIDRDRGLAIVARATTGSKGEYEFRDIPLKDPEDDLGYFVRWQVPEHCHVARPYVGGDTAIDCDAHYASSLIEAPTTGPISADSANFLPVIPETFDDVDLGLFEMPTLDFVDSSIVVMETDADQIIEIPFKLSKPVRYTPLNFLFFTWRFPQNGAEDQIDYWQENPVTTTIPAGTVDGVLRFTIAGDNLTEGFETFFIELDRLANSHKVDTTGKKMPVLQVSIIDDDVKLPEEGDLVREYVTDDGNRFQTAGLQGYPNFQSYFWLLDMSLSTNGRPSFRTNATNGTGAHSVLTSLQAKGPRQISFEWRLSGSADDFMSVFFQDPDIVYDVDNPPAIVAQLEGTTGWQAVNAQIPEGHLLNLNVFKGAIDTGNVQGFVRNLDLGGADTPPTEPQPESLELTGLDEVQEPQPDDERRQGFSQTNGGGVYSGTVKTSANGQDAAGSLSRISVTRKGSLVARATVEGKRNVIRGTFDEGGKFSTQLKAKDGSPRALLLQAQTNLSGGHEEIVGTLETGDGTTSKIVLQKPLPWKRRIDPCPFAGRYHLILPQRAGGAPHAPTGDGWGILTVSETGRVRMVLNLGDGTKVTASSSITPEGRIPIERRIYRGKGSLSGILQVQEVAGISDLDGSLRWVKPENQRSRLHPGGFDLEVAAVGSVHDSTLLVPFPDLVGAGPWQVDIELSGGDFLTEPVVVPVELTRRGRTIRVKELGPAPPLKPNRLLRGSINLRSGTVGLAFNDRVLKKRAIARGILYQRQSTMAGFLTGRSALGAFHLK